MSAQLAILIATAVLAVVAIAAAIIAVRALRQLRSLGDRAAGGDSPFAGLDAPARSSQSCSTTAQPAVGSGSVLGDHREGQAEVVRVVEGRVIVQPTREQVAAATMTRISVRLSVLAAGLAHALRPESRDRISALMRREYRERRRARQRAARAAARMSPPPSDGRGWLGS